MEVYSRSLLIVVTCTLSDACGQKWTQPFRSQNLGTLKFDKLTKHGKITSGSGGGYRAPTISQMQFSVTTKRLETINFSHKELHPRHHTSPTSFSKTIFNKNSPHIVSTQLIHNANKLTNLHMTQAFTANCPQTKLSSK